MLARELIIDEIPPLRPSDKGTKALEWMDEFKVSHLPVIDGTRLLGIVSESDLFDMDFPDDVVVKCKDLLKQVSVTEDQHVFEVIKEISDHKLTVIPVVSLNGNYLGCVSISHLMYIIAEMPMVSNPGGIIVLELNINDYAMSEIARIVENNDARILGTFITSHPDSTKMQVTLKINKTDLQAILQTFERFDYTITASYDQSDYKEDLQSRFDLFMNYLNM